MKLRFILSMLCGAVVLPALCSMGAYAWVLPVAGVAMLVKWYRAPHRPRLI